MKNSKILRTILNFSAMTLALGAPVLSVEQALASAQPEALMGAFVSADGIHVQVPSGGCTAKSSFTVHQETQGDVVYLEFSRVQGDPCLKEMPFGQALIYSFDELNLQQGSQFMIQNPVSARAHSGIHVN